MRWLRRNLKNRFRRALRHPRYTAKALLHDLLGVDERFLATVSNSTPSAIRKFLNEPSFQPELMRHWQESEATLRSGVHPGNDPYAKKVLIQYALTRAMAPELIVETGVSSGISSTYFLSAVRLNGKGRLYSVDINNGEYLPPDKTTGWIVPEHLRDRWTLLIGDSRQVLAPLLSELGNVDIFIHDSSHTYENMKFEMQLAYPRVLPGGLVLCDDANFNPAFQECVQTLRPGVSRVIRNLGIMKKQY